MRKIVLTMIAWLLMATAGCAAARTTSQAAQAQQAEAKEQPQAKEQTQPKEQKDKDKKKKKKREPLGGPGEAADSATRDRRALSQVLRDFGDGFEGSSPRRVMENLDENFDDLPHFEGQVTEFLKQNGELRIWLREASGEVKGDRATLIVNAEMAYSTKATPARTQNRKERIQFDFIRTKKGWKIYEITPRQFFEP